MADIRDNYVRGTGGDRCDTCYEACRSKGGRWDPQIYGENGRGFKRCDYWNWRKGPGYDPPRF